MFNERTRICSKVERFGPRYNVVDQCPRSDRPFRGSSTNSEKPSLYMYFRSSAHNDWSK